MLARIAFGIALGIGIAIAGSSFAACGGSSSTTAENDAAAPDAGFDSACGFPGDKGNSLGVGKFCTSLEDCRDNPRATLCTTIANDDNFFCTFACTADGGADQCGENATCQCQGGRCGCFPNDCI